MAKPKQSKNDAAGRHEPKKLKRKRFDSELLRLQRELVIMQEYVRSNGLKVVVIFEGRDAAGKGGVIKRITERTESPYLPDRRPALRRPNARRHSGTSSATSPHLPAAGEIVLFDRSWYNRAGVERVMGFCTEDEYQEFLRSCPEFERMLVRSGIHADQVLVLGQRRGAGAPLPGPGPTTRSAAGSSARWTSSRATVGRVLPGQGRDVPHTDIKHAPWYVVEADDKRRARLNCIAHLLSLITYEDLTPPPLELPPRTDDAYIRPPIEEQTFVPQVY